MVDLRFKEFFAIRVLFDLVVGDLCEKIRNYFNYRRY